jgi:hypothetical protein
MGVVSRTRAEDHKSLQDMHGKCLTASHKAAAIRAWFGCAVDIGEESIGENEEM